VNKPFTIHDAETNRTLKLSFSEFADLIIGAQCAEDFFSKKRGKDFSVLIKKLKEVSL
jgi:hypothetical protein